MKQITNIKKEAKKINSDWILGTPIFISPAIILGLRSGYD